MILNEMAMDLKKAGFEKQMDVFKFTEYQNDDFPLFLSIKKVLFSLLIIAWNLHFSSNKDFKNRIISASKLDGMMMMQLTT